jgi:pectin methylesterase-like acyl-CoA thioesterase
MWILMASLPTGVAQAATLEVKEGESIQAAVTQAKAGDTIKVYPGTYHETVFVDKDDISLIGVVEDGEWPHLDGEKVLNDAILYSGNGFSVEWFKITKYKGNAIMGSREITSRSETTGSSTPAFTAFSPSSVITVLSRTTY